MNGTNIEDYQIKSFKLLTYNQIQNLDKLTQEKGFEAKQLMGMAALASYNKICELGLLKKEITNKIKSIHILCGNGNNGGDGFALAYLLANHSEYKNNFEVCVYTLNNLDTNANNATNKQNIKRSIASVFYFEQIQNFKVKINSYDIFLQSNFESGDLIIDALLGIGQIGEAKKEILEIIKEFRNIKLRNNKVILISLDLPTTLLENKTFENQAPDYIFSFGPRKLALYLDKNISTISTIYNLDIGLLPIKDYKNFLSTQDKSDLCLDNFLIDTDYYHQHRNFIFDSFKRTKSSHKYKNGHSLMIGASLGMEGAIIMAARTFFASGGGVLEILSPNNLARLNMLQILPSCIYLEQNEFEKNRANKNENEFENYKNKNISILIGSGLKNDDINNLKNKIKNLIGAVKEKTFFILDAGATNLIKEFDFSKHFTILLPHTGEWQKLGGSKIENVESLINAKNFYIKENFKSYILIKDCISVLICRNPVSKNVETYIINNINSNLAMAGTGDNLAGIVTSIFARFNLELLNEEIIKNGDFIKKEGLEKNGGLPSLVSQWHGDSSSHGREASGGLEKNDDLDKNDDLEKNDGLYKNDGLEKKKLFIHKLIIQKIIYSVLLLHEAANFKDDNNFNFIVSTDEFHTRIKKILE